MSDLFEDALIGYWLITEAVIKVGSVLVAQVHRVRHHELLPVLKISITSPVQLEELAVCVHLVVIGIGKVGMLLDSLDHLWQECWILLLKEVEAYAQALSQ